MISSKNCTSPKWPLGHRKRSTRVTNGLKALLMSSTKTAMYSNSGIGNWSSCFSIRSSSWVYSICIIDSQCFDTCALRRDPSLKKVMRSSGASPCSSHNALSIASSTEHCVEAVPWS